MRRALLLSSAVALLSACVATPSIVSPTVTSGLLRVSSPAADAAPIVQPVTLPLAGRVVVSGDDAAPLPALTADAMPMDAFVAQVMRDLGLSVVVAAGDYPTVSADLPAGLDRDTLTSLVRDLVSSRGGSLTDGGGGVWRLAPVGRVGGVSRVIWLRYRRAADLAGLGGGAGGSSAPSSGVGVGAAAAPDPAAMPVSVVPVVAGRAVVISGPQVGVDQLVEVVRSLDRPSLDGWVAEVIPCEDVLAVVRALPALLGSDAVVSAWGPGVLVAASADVVQRARSYVRSLAGTDPERVVRYEPLGLPPESCPSLVAGSGGAAPSLTPFRSTPGQSASLVPSSSSPSGTATVTDTVSGALPVSVSVVTGACILSGDAYAVAGALERLRAADRPAQRVQIEASLLEVSLGSGADSGLRMVIDGLLGSTHGVKLGAGDPVQAVASGGAYAIGVVGALKLTSFLERRDTGVNVLSQPVVWVDVGQDATLNAGDQVPVLDRITTNDTTGGRVTQQITYRDVGVVLRVTPEARRGNLLRLKVSQEVSDAVKTTTSAIDSPTITRRSVDTVVSAPSGQTVIMGGLVRQSDQNSKVGPGFFSDVPLLGDLVSSATRTRNRTELVLLVTATVINDNDVTVTVQRAIDRITGGGR